MTETREAGASVLIMKDHLLPLNSRLEHDHRKSRLETYINIQAAHLRIFIEDTEMQQDLTFLSQVKDSMKHGMNIIHMRG